MKRILLEGLVVAIVGGALSFAANEISPRRLKLNRDYGLLKTQPVAAPGLTNTAPGMASATNSPAEVVAERLRAKGLSLANSNQVAHLFHDPRRLQQLVIFVDARDDDHYLAGHIPGAFQLDFYRPEKYLQTVLPACQIAEQVVVYCNGGDCEDSELTATFLRDAGIPPAKLLVYGGGMSEWTTNSMPIEIGVRGSGQIRNPAK